MIYDSADAIADILGTTFVALKARFRALAQVVDAVGAERKALADEIMSREKEAAAKVRLGTLSADDKAMYRVVLSGAS